MGHTRLGTIPKTRNWDDVVQGFILSAEEGDLNQDDRVLDIAIKTLDAIDQGLKEAINDFGLNYVFFMLMKLVLASRSNNWETSFENMGVPVNKETTFFDLLSEFENKIEKEINTKSRKSDVSENALQAAVETLTKLVRPECESLFTSSVDDLLVGLKKYSTKKGIGILSQYFFSSFITRNLNFYLSRITATFLGRSSLNNIGDITKFNDILKLHCDQSAFIVKDFAGTWVKKTNYEEGIKLSNTKKFLAVAIKKIKEEFAIQKKGVFS